ncbi:MAG TPA: aminodeoxychorismate synthase component I [Vicinamibacterales bacterium]|nr:aminodeoxychorismate synthase component I [Vicinamibacterales bacterium]
MRLRFDFAGVDGRPAPVRYERPVRSIVAGRLDDVMQAMHAVEQALEEGRHVAGVVAYEAAPAFDAALTTREPAAGPLLWFGVFDAPVAADPLATLVAHLGPAPLPAGAGGGLALWTPAVTPADHHRAVAAVREAIAAGDVYQANYTFRLHGEIDAASLEAHYLRLAAAHRAPYSAYLDLGPWQILSLSPELFFRLTGRRIETRPMKGTAPRGRWPAEDTAAGAALAASEKNRAENVMIVDMARNDLGRVAAVGSVRVGSLFDVERYPTVFQMVSTVAADLREGTRLGEVFTALFPAASITGAPKSASTRLIAALESSPRGVYCGAIGYATPDGDAVFNVAIRTTTVETATSRAVFGTGGGITWDSAPGDEHAEALAKTACLTVPPPFCLVETLRLDDGRYVRGDRHLARLRESAAYFDFACEPGALEAALASHAREHQTGRRCVRVRLAPGGHVDVSSRPLDRLPPGPLSIAVSTLPVDRADPFLHHKTTRRELYERQARVYPDVFDVLLQNREGELTEFTRANVVLELDGRRWTPPRTCGLLGGVFRECLVESGEVGERLLVPHDLGRARRLWWVNSLREWIEVSRPVRPATSRPSPRSGG